MENSHENFPSQLSNPDDANGYFISWRPKRQISKLKVTGPVSKRLNAGTAFTGFTVTRRVESGTGTKYNSTGRVGYSFIIKV